MKTKKAKITNNDLESKVINDIREMDSDNFNSLIEYLYPVKVDYDCETDLITVESNTPLSLEEIFDEKLTDFIEKE